MLEGKQRFLHLISLTFLVLILCGFSNPQFKELEILLVRQEYKQASDTANRLLKIQTKDSEKQTLRYFLGLIEVKSGEYRQAQQRFKVLRKEVRDVKLRDRVYLGLIDAYYLDGKYQVAQKIAKDYLAKYKKTDYKSLFYFKLARANLKLANWIEARDGLKKIIREHPRSLEVNYAKQLLAEKQYFAVQVGAFLDRAKAQKQVEKLKLGREYAYIVETTDQRGKRFYRVRVGQLAYLDEAEELKVKLAKQGYPARVYP